MTRPRFQSLGQDAPASPPGPFSPGRLETSTVNGAAAAFTRRSATLHLSVSCHFRITTRLLPLLVETICQPSEKPFATRRISFQKPTYPPSDQPVSPSLALLSSPYPQRAPLASPSVADAPPDACYKLGKQPCSTKFFFFFLGGGE